MYEILMFNVYRKFCNEGEGNSMDTPNIELYY